MKFRKHKLKQSNICSAISMLIFLMQYAHQNANNPVTPATNSYGTCLSDDKRIRVACSSLVSCKWPRCKSNKNDPWTSLIGHSPFNTKQRQFLKGIARGGDIQTWTSEADGENQKSINMQVYIFMNQHFKLILMYTNVIRLERRVESIIFAKFKV